MINCEKFFKELRKNDFRFFTGVPDSLLKNICAYIADHTDRQNHIIAANEGGAVAAATGHYLATGKPAVVYMQNSGLGNAINPLVSLTSSHVYSIPLLLVIGWRGEPGIRDEPQHQEMGKVQNEILEALNIPYKILSPVTQDTKKILKDAKKHLKKNNSPFALIVKKNTFSPYNSKKTDNSLLELTRERALEIIINNLNSGDIVVSTTGKTSREIFELREKRKDTHEKDFLTVGSMGHASSIGLGIALSKKSRRVWCIDGDGSLIMHMGSLTIVGQAKPENFYHIILNNFSHESVGGQPTASKTMNIPELALAGGYRYAYSLDNEKSIEASINKLRKLKGPVLLEIKCRPGSRSDLGRPTIQPLKNRNNFMNFLKDGN